VSEHLHVERPFLDQLAGLGWEVIDQGYGIIPSDPAASLRTSFREVKLPEVFRESVRAINLTGGGEPWLTDRQVNDLRDQVFGQPNRNLLEANEEAHKLLLKAQVDVNMVMVHKFSKRTRELPSAVADALTAWGSIPSSETFGVVNPPDRILLMIDEAHRTQSSDLGDNLFEAFPNATRIAFTGTPLITEQHGSRRTVKRFGDYIDTYKPMDAMRDGTTLQILYEGRTAETALRDKHQFDTKFEDLFRDRSEEEILAIKKKYGATGDILEAEQRIGAIARDLVNHYIDKKLREHNLLQAIARVNRVAPGKRRGFIIDYSVVHELCHLHHRNHTAAFWNEVDKVMPEYRERKEWLRKNGAGLDVADGNEPQRARRVSQHAGDGGDCG